MTSAEFDSGQDTSRQAAVMIRRSVNDAIKSQALKVGVGSSKWQFVCECGDIDCDGLVELTLVEYDIRAPGFVTAHTAEDD